MRDHWPDRLDMPPAKLHEPRSVGDLCYSGYWRTWYVVLHIEYDEDNWATWITVLNLTEPNESVESGTVSVKRHLTRWDWSRDKYCSYNFIEEQEDDSFRDYEEFLMIMRDCVDYRDRVSY